MMKMKRLRGRPEKNYVLRLSVGLTAEEAQAYTDGAYAPEYLRFLFRKSQSLCRHHRIEFDQQTGEKTCLNCGVRNPEDFSRWMVTPEQALANEIEALKQEYGDSLVAVYGWKDTCVRGWRLSDGSLSGHVGCADEDILYQK